MSARKKAVVTLGVGLALLAVAVILVLTRSPPRVLRAGAQEGVLVASANTSSQASYLQACQAGEALPAGVSGIRLPIWAFFGTSMHVAVYSGSQVITKGSRGPAWTGSTVTVPIAPLRHAVSPVTVCFSAGPNSQPLFVTGVATSPANAATSGTGEPLAGRVDIEYLAAGSGSWWSRIQQVSWNMGLGRAFSGTWIVLLIFALMAATGVLAVRLVLREPA
jgi:hypothetical protein